SSSSRHRSRDPYRDIGEKKDRAEKMAREKELEAIKEQYLGGSSKDKKKPPRTMATKLRDRFRFDWDSAEDTTRDDGTGAGAPLLYGRGFLAGIDRREQKKAAAASASAAALHKDDLDGTRVEYRRHGTAKALSEMTERDWRILREDFDISYKGSRSAVPPRPMRTWAESALGEPLLRAVAMAGYATPTPIQMAAVPLGLRRRDLIGVAQTGSGKTAAFVLPMLAYIMNLMTSPPPMIMSRGEADDDVHDPQGPYAVVMAPTRELAQQIERETTKLAAAACHGSIKVVSVVGGQPIEEQAFRIRQGCEVIVATPGRLLDCLERRHLVLNRCSYVVLDEADRMVDMGFEPQVASVLDAMPTSNLKPENEAEEQKNVYRTTHMFSATMPAAVERLARKYPGTRGKGTGLVTQNVIMVKDSDKLPRLKRILADLGDDNTAIVFCNTKLSVDGCAKDLDRAGFRVTTLHGGKSQDQREASLDGFRSRRFNVLVATDIAGRGIDVPDVAHVINFEMPGAVDAYTHRIGRTGRAGKKGLATSFLTLRDSEIFFDLKQMLVQSNSPVPPELARHEASRFKPGSVPDRPPRRNDTVYASRRGKIYCRRELKILSS
ncbi:hypothetical protein BRADI_2g15606v3, partial [Brachypodium distachyon]